MPGLPAHCDVAVVGAGIVGLATARELLRRDPDRTVCVIDREPVIAAHQTSHNSGVIHAGIYYRPGSGKARMAVAAVAELERFCAEHDVPFRRAGKLIVATTPQELPALDALARRAAENGVAELHRIGPERLVEIEPHVTGVAALHSPRTGIVDYRRVAEALADDVRAATGTIVTGCTVDAVEETPEGTRIRHANGTLVARRAIVCAGAFAQRLAPPTSADAPRLVPFRGAYLSVRPERRHLVRGLVYPVPDPRLPFLGVHFTPTIDGDLTIGPTALLVGAVDAYRPWRIRARDAGPVAAWPGTWRLARRWWRTAAAELWTAASVRARVRDAARYVPELRVADVRPGPAGVRAQAVGRDGALLDDFLLDRRGHALHVLNAPSPAATAALPLARHIVDRAERELDVSPGRPGRRPA